MKTELKNLKEGDFFYYGNVHFKLKIVIKGYFYSAEIQQYDDQPDETSIVYLFGGTKVTKDKSVVFNT